MLGCRSTLCQYCRVQAGEEHWPGGKWFCLMSRVKSSATATAAAAAVHKIKIKFQLSGNVTQLAEK